MSKTHHDESAYHDKNHRRPYLRRRLVALASALALLTGVPAAGFDPIPATAAEPDSAYVMTYFRESLDGTGNSNNIHLAVSLDGRQWQPLNDNMPVLDPSAGTGGIRDPFIHRLQDGTWVILATDLEVGVPFGQANPNVHVWTSPDLVTWSSDRLLSLNAANPSSYTWAPAVHWDSTRNQYGITFSAFPAGGPEGVIMVAYTTDFRTATPAVRFFDNGGRGGVIDSDVITDVGGQNYLYYRGPNPDAGLLGARSNSLEPGSFVQYSEAPNLPGCAEAPTLVRSLTNPSSWTLWGDNYCPNSFFVNWQGDIAIGQWSAVSSGTFTAPIGSKHNSIKPITRADYDRLLGRFGGSKSIRLKSYNFPDSYLRHAEFKARIDPIPFDPQADSQWRMVAGLFGPGAVSFESVNQPGWYLRHSGFQLVLAPNDGSAGFRADASFLRTPGLADSNWDSFQSVNYPDRYLRHSNMQLSLTQISTVLDRSDATFDVVF